MRITARVSEQAHSLLTSEAEKLMRNDRSKIPYGELLDGILIKLASSWEEDDWDALRERLLGQREKRKNLRMDKDRDRKRAKRKGNR